jgi:hypothetical protein
VESTGNRNLDSEATRQTHVLNAIIRMLKKEMLLSDAALQWLNLSRTHFL